MMLSLFQKARVAVLSDMHTLLDKVIDMNSLGACEQYVRDLQTARDTLDNQRAVHKNRVDTLPNEIASLNARHAEIDGNIDTLLRADPNHPQAKSLMEALIGLDADLKDKQAQLAHEQEELAGYNDSVSKFDSKLAEETRNVARLQRLSRETAEKNRETTAVSRVAVGDAPDTSRLEQQITEQAAVADNAQKRALGRATDAVTNTVHDATIEAMLAARRQKLAGNTPS